MRDRNPIYCRPEAYRLLASQIPVIESSDGLLNGAVAISMHELTDADPADVDAKLQALADRIRERVRAGSPDAVLAHAHEVLFDEEGFAGNTDDYYNPINSYLPTVLTSRRGLPITLAIIYKVVLERVGLPTCGIGAPGHFLAGVRTAGSLMLVDPFFGGRVLSTEEAFGQSERATGVAIPRTAEMLGPTSHRLWLARMLRNLMNHFAQADRSRDLGAMLELQSLLATD